MTAQPVARHVELITRAVRPFMEAIALTPYFRPPTGEPICDFFAGNPQELPLPGFVDALTSWSIPRDKDWFAYKMGDPTAQATAAASLSEKLGIPFEADDVSLTRGAFGGLCLTLQAVVDEGDEVVFITPPWFFYEALIIGARATPVRARVDEATFDLDIDAIAAAITERTRAIIVNTPNNPTGRIYPAETLERLAAVLTEASRRNGRAIFLISDESYSRILFDGRAFVSPGRFYPHSFLVHTYSKSALSPGQRLGFVAMPPSMPDREQWRECLMLVGLAIGYGLPDALMMYALPDIDRLSIDLGHLQAKRDRMVRALRDYGYELHVPEATFYLLARSPIEDDFAFAELLARQNVFVLPGKAVEMPGYFRISLTASDDMIDRALPVFAEAMEKAAAKTA